MGADLQNGKAVVYGIQNNGTPITLSGIATFILDTLKGVHHTDLEEIKDETNFDASWIGTNGYIEVDINWTPSGATRAAAGATAVFLPVLTNVTLSNFAIDAFNGNYQLRSDQSIDLDKKASKAVLKIRKYDDATQNTAATTSVSG